VGEGGGRGRERIGGVKMVVRKGGVKGKEKRRSEGGDVRSVIGA